MIEFFDRIKIDNKDLPMSELCVIDSYWKAEAVVLGLEASRVSRFEAISQKAWFRNGMIELDIRDPKLPRQRKISKRLKSNNEFGKNIMFFNP